MDIIVVRLGVNGLIATLNFMVDMHRSWVGIDKGIITLWISRSFQQWAI